MSTDDVERLAKRLDDLMASYGALMQTQTRHDERIDNAAADRAEIRQEIKDLEGQLLSAIGRSEQRTRERIEHVGKECHGFWDEYRRDRERALERSERSKISNRTLAIGAGAAVISACGVIVALISVIVGG